MCFPAFTTHRLIILRLSKRLMTSLRVIFLFDFINFEIKTIICCDAITGFLFIFLINYYNFKVKFFKKKRVKVQTNIKNLNVFVFHLFNFNQLICN